MNVLKVSLRSKDKCILQTSVDWESRVMMYAKASSDDTAKKKCINNATIMQNQSRKKCTENAKTSHQRMPWNAKRAQTIAKKKTQDEAHEPECKHVQKAAYVQMTLL